MPSLTPAPCARSTDVMTSAAALKAVPAKNLRREKFEMLLGMTLLPICLACWCQINGLVRIRGSWQSLFGAYLAHDRRPRLGASGARAYQFDLDSVTVRSVERMQVLDATPALIEGHPHQFDKWRANAHVERSRNLGRRQTGANTLTRRLNRAPATREQRE